MIGLISTPSTWSGAEHERRDQVPSAAWADDESGKARGWGLGIGVPQPNGPNPNPQSLFFQVIGEGGELVAQVLHRGERRIQFQDGRRRGRVDVHVPRVGEGALVGVAQRPVAMRPLVDPDSRERIPLAEEDVVFRVTLGVGDVENGHARRLAGNQRDHDEDARRGESPTTGRRTEEHGGDERTGRRRQDDARRAEPVEEWDQDEAAGGRAGEIGGVHRIDPRREPRDGQRDHEAAGEKWQRGERVDGQHQPQVLRRVVEADAEANQREQRHDRGGRVDDGLRGEQSRRRVPIEPASGDVREHTARAQAEQGDRDGEEREVVVHDHREDARERELGHQQRRRDERDSRQISSGDRPFSGHGPTV